MELYSFTVFPSPEWSEEMLGNLKLMWVSDRAVVRGVDKIGIGVEREDVLEEYFIQGEGWVPLKKEEQDAGKLSMELVSRLARATRWKLVRPRLLRMAWFYITTLFRP